MEINVLSFCDGMSGAQLALQRTGIKVKNYFAAEIDKFAIKVTQKNFPNTIQLGDVTKINGKDLPKIDLLIGGSPCQGFSLAGQQQGFKDPRSKLFFEFIRLKHECNPTYFLLENVKMKKEHENVISTFLNISPIEINSNLVSAQNRKRNYWTNIANEPFGLFGEMECIIPIPEDKGIFLKDILEPEVSEKYYLSENMLKYFENRRSNFNRGLVNIRDANGKASCLTASMCKCDISDNFIQEKAACLTVAGNSGGLHSNMTLINHLGKIRRLTPIECERLQTVPDNYTDCVSDTQRYKMLGNGFTIDVISHILNFLKFYLTNQNNGKSNLFQ